MKQVSANPVLAQCYVYEQASTSDGKKSCICEVILFSKLNFVFFKSDYVAHGYSKGKRTMSTVRMSLK